MNVTVVCFLDDGSGRLATVVSGPVADGEDELDAALRLPEDIAGFKPQHVHVVERDAEHVLLWGGGDFRPWQHDRVAGADAARRSLTAEQYQRDVRVVLERHYLRADTPQGGSGFGGSLAEWRSKRGHVADVIGRDGTFCDVGCANGFLAESVVTWCAERDVQVEPYGVDISAALVARARERLPQWADRFWVGDALTWTPPRTFDTVHALLDFVPHGDRKPMIDNLLGWLVPDGRLVISHYGRLERARDVVEGLGFRVDGEAGPAVWLLRQP